jgi:hypothetical protein
MIAPSQLPSLITTITTPRPGAPIARLPRRRRRLHLEPNADVAIRFAGERDAAVLGKLEQMDERLLPAGARLLAELDGVPVAAMSVADGTVVADPFARTAGVVDLMRVRARQLRMAA